MMAALAGTFLTDPFPDPDIQKTEAEIERLRYMPWRDEDARREIARCIGVLETHLLRMRKAAA